MTAAQPGGGTLPPLVIAVAPNGARRTKQDHRAVPVTAEELARVAAECADAGAAMIHLHVRDAEQRHLLDAAAYRDALAAIDRAVGRRVIAQITTEAVGLYRPEQQMAVVKDVRPEAVSIAVREIVPDAAAEHAAADFFRWLALERIHVQHIVYSAEDLRYFYGLRDRGVFPAGPAAILFVLGRYTVGQVSDPRTLIPFLAEVHADDIWAMCAFGRNESACATAASALLGHIRVGFENNLHLPDNTLASGNPQLVAHNAAAAALIGRPVANADTAREIFRIER